MPTPLFWGFVGRYLSEEEGLNAFSDLPRAIVKSRVLAEEVKSGVSCWWIAFHQPPNVGMRIRHESGYESFYRANR